MTVEYNSELATASFAGFHKLLMRWRGSIYKLLWKEFLFYLVLYYAVAVLYHVILTPEQKRTFENISDYCDTRCNTIPVIFVLGFYVSNVVDRFWVQYNSLPWTTKLAVCVTGHIHGTDDAARFVRRTIIRHMVLAYTLTMVSICPSVKKRFPTIQHIVNAGLMTEREMDVFESIETQCNKYVVPVVWATMLVTRARKDGLIKTDVGVNQMIKDISAIRGNCGALFGFDWVSIPLVYTQVATLVVYSYFGCTLVGRQYIGNLEMHGDLYVPVFTLLEYVFYVGWLKVAEELMNPFGEDDDDFDINALIDSITQGSYRIVDDIPVHAEMPQLVKDQFWNEPDVNIPYTTAAQSLHKAPYLGTAEGIETVKSSGSSIRRNRVLPSAASTSSESLHHHGECN